MPPLKDKDADIRLALSRVYPIRQQSRSFLITLPAPVARAFVERFGPNVIFEVTDDGILLKPANRDGANDLPDWAKPVKPKPRRKP